MSVVNCLPNVYILSYEILISGNCFCGKR